jgi:hypothetical protein
MTTPHSALRIPHWIFSALLLSALCAGCLPTRQDNQTHLEGRPLMTLMQQLGGPLEVLPPAEGGEGRVINEVQKLWHYLSISSNTQLTLFRSRYSAFFKVQETVIARFDLPEVGTFDVTAVDEDLDEQNGVDTALIKFTASVTSPSPGTARGEIYPFPRELNGEQFPPSLHMVLPPAFTVPTGSHLDPRKRYMRDEPSIKVFQQIVRDLYAVGQREVVLPAPSR